MRAKFNVVNQNDKTKIFHYETGDFVGYSSKEV